MTLEHSVGSVKAKRPALAHRVAFYTSASLAALRPGDVLLYHGCDPFARSIQHFDDTPYYHAALLLDDGLVAESVMAGGVGARPLAETFGRREWAMVRRYRDNLPPHAAEAGVHPVVARAKALVTSAPRYDYEQLLPLALLLITRKVPRVASYGRVVVGLLERLNGDLRAARKRRDGTKDAALVCSKFVAECYASAATADPAGGGPYALRLGPPSSTISSREDSGTVLAEVMNAAETPSGDVTLRSFGPPAAPLSDQELETLITAYLNEVQGRASSGRATRGEIGIDRRRLQSAVVTFASLLGEQVNEAPVLHRGTRMPGDHVAALAWLANYAARLVTPGDLGRSPSLEDIGMLRLENGARLEPRSQRSTGPTVDPEQPRRPATRGRRAVRK